MLIKIYSELCELSVSAAKSPLCLRRIRGSQGLRDSFWLRHAELLPLGIRVTIIEPGTFRTDFLDASSLRRAARVIDDYRGSGGTARQWADTANHDQLGDPVKGAAAIVTVATSTEPPLRVQLGTDSLARVEACGVCTRLEF